MHSRFAKMSQLDHGGGGRPKCALTVGGDRDDRNAEISDRGEDAANFLGLAAVGKHQQQVVGRQAAQVPVGGFRRVQKVGSLSGRGERGRYLPANQPSLSHPGHDHAAAAIAKQLDRFREVLAEAGGNLVEARRLFFQDGPGFAQQLKLAVWDNRAFDSRAHFRVILDCGQTGGCGTYTAHRQTVNVVPERPDRRKILSSFVLRLFLSFRQVDPYLGERPFVRRFGGDLWAPSAA